MSGMKFLVIGLIGLLALGAGAVVATGPVMNVLGEWTNPDARLVQEDEANQIVMGLVKSSSDQTTSVVEQKDDKEKEKEDEDKESGGKGSNKVAQAIAKFFSVGVDEVNKLHADGLGYGEIVRAYALAKSTGKSVVDIIALKKDGKGWGEIEKSLNVTPGKLNTTLGMIMRENKGKGKSVSANANATPPAKGKSKDKDK